MQGGVLSKNVFGQKDATSLKVSFSQIKKGVHLTQEKLGHILYLLAGSNIFQKITLFMGQENGEGKDCRSSGFRME